MVFMLELALFDLSQSEQDIAKNLNQIRTSVCSTLIIIKTFLHHVYLLHQLFITFIRALFKYSEFLQPSFKMLNRRLSIQK